MFKDFYEVLWGASGAPDLDTISKTFSHLLIVEDNEETY